MKQENRLKILRVLLFIIIVLHCSKSYGLSTDLLQTKISTREETQKNISFLDFIYGKPTKNGILYLPLGRHTQIAEENFSSNNLIGIVYNSFSFGTFINSFHERTWYLVIIRNIFSYYGFGIDYFAGLLYGYEGKLSQIEGIPLRETFLFQHNLNPVVSLGAHYEVEKHIQAQVMITPLVILYGVKYNL